MPEDEEVLGEEEATSSEEEAGGGGGGLLGFFDFSGGLMDSIVIKMLVGAIALVAIVLLVIFITNWTLENIMRGSDPEAGQAEEQATQREEGAANPLSTFELKEFILTKRDPRSGRVSTYQIKLHLAYNNEAKSALGGELESRRAQIRDRIYTVLGSKKVENLTYANQQSLKDDLIVELNRLLQSRYRIQDIYFTQFVIQ